MHYLQQDCLCRFILCTLNQGNAGKKEDGAQDAKYKYFFYGTAGPAAIYESYSCYYQSNNTQQ